MITLTDGRQISEDAVTIRASRKTLANILLANDGLTYQLGKEDLTALIAAPDKQSLIDQKVKSATIAADVIKTP
jgi:membrane-bound inhibitor of C-type lysozyme